MDPRDQNHLEGSKSVPVTSVTRPKHGRPSGEPAARVACLVHTSENPSTANSVKHWKILESSNSNLIMLGATNDQLFCPLFVNALMKAYI